MGSVSLKLQNHCASVSVVGTRKNPSQWDTDGNLSAKVLGNISTSGQKLTWILPLSPSFLPLSSVLAWWQEQGQLLWDQVERAERTEGTWASPTLSHQANIGAHSSASCYMKNKQILTCVGQIRYTQSNEIQAEEPAFHSLEVTSAQMFP